MNSFVYDIPTKVYFGENQIGNLGKELARFGKRILLCYGGGSIKKTGLYDQIVDKIRKAGLEFFEHGGIEPNPRISSVNTGADICKKESIDVVLAVGGGSVIDCAKYIGAATYYDGDAWDILLQKIDVRKCLPIVTVLTLAATGSEMDCGGVISNPATKEKIGLIFPPMQPRVSFLDPTNTYSVSTYQTACGAADILSHIIETYFCMSQELQMLDGVMESLMRTVINYAPVALREPYNYEARANLMWASSWAINGFIRSGRQQAWSCHPMEHELSAIYDITHGLGLAILTPRWLAYCLDETTVSKYYQFGVNVWGIKHSLPQMEVAEAAISKTGEFFSKTLQLKSSFNDIGIDNQNFPVMAEKAVKGGLAYAFKPLKAKDVINIFNMCLKKTA
jgi:alcohol dehydrogenase YqhD (iron-dependent ADH family)